MANLEMQVITHMLDRGSIQEFLDVGLQNVATGLIGSHLRRRSGDPGPGRVRPKIRRDSTPRVTIT